MSGLDAMLDEKMARTYPSSGLVKPTPESTAVLVCDVQERFRSLIPGFGTVVDTAEMMLKAARELGMLCVFTEQYPKALEHTVEELQPYIREAQARDRSVGFRARVYEKSMFSMAIPEVCKLLVDEDINTIILVGIEAHVCVLQTVLDFRAKGYEVFPVMDGISASSLYNRSIAQQRFISAGAHISTRDSMVFQLTGDAKHPHFRAVSALVKEYGEKENELAKE
jgi:nicotinamidase-related amidase